MGYRANLYFLENTGITIALCANSTDDPETEAAYGRLFDRILALALESGADGTNQG